MSQVTRESGQPTKTYSHPITFADDLFSRLGVAEGFSAFQHRLQYAEQIMIALDFALEGIKQGRHINKITKKEAKVILDEVAVKKMQCLFRHGVNLAIFRNPFAPHEISENKIIYPFDKPPRNCELRRLPSMRNLFPRDALTQKQSWSVEIQEPVLVRHAFENEDPATLSLQGGFVDKFSDGTMPKFRSYDEIEGSVDYTYHVSKNYYNKVLGTVFTEWYEQSKIVHTNLNVLIEELRSFGIDSQETGYVPDITPLE